MAIFDRLALSFSTDPLIIIGNQPVVARMANLERLVESGVLREMLAEIGWAQGEKVDKAQEWKPKLAVLKKREFSELEAAQQTE